MHKEILTPEQIELLPLVTKFSKDFGLVGGTAVALHLGHRESVDFDLFTRTDFDTRRIRKNIERGFPIQRIVTDEKNQYTIIILGVRLTFFQYPYHIAYGEKFEKVIRIPDLATLAAMKAFALGRRAKWKDYVDLYFILQDHLTLHQINQKAKEIFGPEYNEKIFRTQLAYFDDMNYSETVTYRPGFAVTDKTIKKALVQYSLE